MTKRRSSINVVNETGGTCINHAHLVPRRLPRCQIMSRMIVLRQRWKLDDKIEIRRHAHRSEYLERLFLNRREREIPTITELGNCVHPKYW